MGCSCQKTCPAEGRGETGEHAEEGGLAGPGWAEEGDDLAGVDGKICRRDHLDAVLAGLGVVLLNALGTYDGSLHGSLSKGE